MKDVLYLLMKLPAAPISCCRIVAKMKQASAIWTIVLASFVVSGVVFCGLQAALRNQSDYGALILLIVLPLLGFLIVGISLGAVIVDFFGNCCGITCSFGSLWQVMLFISIPWVLLMPIVLTFSPARSLLSLYVPSTLTLGIFGSYDWPTRKLIGLVLLTNAIVLIGILCGKALILHVK